MARSHKTLNSCRTELAVPLVDAFRQFHKLEIAGDKCGMKKLCAEFKKYALKHPDLKPDPRFREILTDESYNPQTFHRFPFSHSGCF